MRVSKLLRGNWQGEMEEQGKMKGASVMKGFSNKERSHTNTTICAQLVHLKIGDTIWVTVKILYTLILKYKSRNSLQC